MTESTTPNSTSVMPGAPQTTFSRADNELSHDVEKDTGVRLYTVAVFKHLEPRSILYKSGLSRQELLNALYDVLPQADIISIRRVRERDGYRPPTQEEIVEAEYGPETQPATEKQLNLIKALSKKKRIDLPEGFPNITKRQASEWIDKALKKSNNTKEAP